MQLQQASRKNAKIKLALQGPSGSGKSYSALLMAYGLCNDWTKIAVIDSENRSSELYAHLGPFNVLHLCAPFTPERYTEALKACEKAGMQVVIIDSISHEWMGSGGILEAHALMQGNSFTNWAKLTPRHNTFVQYMLQSPLHIIGTIRSKQEYVLAEKNGKQVPEKIGMKGVTRDGMDFEFTLVFELNMKNYAVATKDRTSLFINQPEFILTKDTGLKILQWCQEGIPEEIQLPIEERINACATLADLLKLYYENPTEDASVLQLYSTKRAELEKHPVNNNISKQKNSTNGSYNRKAAKEQA